MRLCSYVLILTLCVCFISEKMFSWAFEVCAPEVCERLLMDFYKISQDQV